MSKCDRIYLIIVGICTLMPLNCAAASAVVQRIINQGAKPFFSGLVTGAATYKLRSNHVKKIIAGSDVATTTYFTINHYKKNPLPGSEQHAELTKLELTQYSAFNFGVASEGYQVKKGDVVLKQFPQQSSNSAYKEAEKFLQSQQKPLIDKINAVVADNQKDFLSIVAIKGGAFAAGATLGYKFMGYMYQHDNKNPS